MTKYIVVVRDYHKFFVIPEEDLQMGDIPMTTPGDQELAEQAKIALEIVQENWPEKINNVMGQVIDLRAFST